MWILIQKEIKGDREKYMIYDNYINMIKYIFSFNNVKRYNKYYFVSHFNNIEFIIKLGEYNEGNSR